MKIFYYQRADGLTNFGDLLNIWLWNRLLPDVFDEDETITFVGIGTLLNNLLPQRIPQAKKLIIFSTGAGYEKNLNSIPANWHIACVRGVLSAKKLGLPPDLVVTDGAILVRRLFQPTAKKTSSFAFMPHIHHAKFAGTAWQKICTQIGFQYIDPRWNIEKVLANLSGTEVIITEAMHGAIVADALRGPWIPVVTSARILQFKWLDWCSSMGLEYRPHYLMPLRELYPPVAQGIRSSARAIQHWGNCWQQLPYLAQIWRDRQQLCAAQLVHIAQTAHPYLSQEKQLEQLTIELEDRLHAIGLIVNTGVFGSNV
ncbi:MAG: polysaccharide pyruvyl transferase family protein [Moorea sp. SIO2B7]|nr:polysaccharide pyruvyl transferase family protein [Moorena sp. SIO2B7]